MLIQQSVEQLSSKGRALWFSIKMKDYELAQNLITQNASLDGCYEIKANHYISTISLLVSQLAHVRVTKSHKVMEYTIPDRLLDQIISSCTKVKFYYKIKLNQRTNYNAIAPQNLSIDALYSLHQISQVNILSFQLSDVQKDEEIFKEKNGLVQKLIFNGATLKNSNCKGQRIFPQLDIDGVSVYLREKQQFQTTKEGFNYLNQKQSKLQTFGK